MKCEMQVTTDRDGDTDTANTTVIGIKKDETNRKKRANKNAIYINVRIRQVYV